MCTPSGPGWWACGGGPRLEEEMVYGFEAKSYQKKSISGDMKSISR